MALSTVYGIMLVICTTAVVSYVVVVARDIWTLSLLSASSGPFVGLSCVTQNSRCIVVPAGAPSVESGSLNSRKLSESTMPRPFAPVL